jgi:hypothetical protein
MNLQDFMEDASFRKHGLGRSTAAQAGIIGLDFVRRIESRTTGVRT